MGLRRTRLGCSGGSQDTVPCRHRGAAVTHPQPVANFMDHRKAAAIAAREGRAPGR
jgi:hypothetical protein